MGPSELLLLVAAVSLVVTALLIRRVGWVLGLLLGLTLGPVATTTLIFAVVFAAGLLLRSR